MEAHNLLTHSSSIIGFIEGLGYWLRMALTESYGWSFNMPPVVLMLILAALYLHISVGFVGLRYFGHAIDAIRGRFSSPSDPGVFTHKDAIMTTAMGTVGLGSIAGIPIAIVKGGPGVVFWMLVLGLLFTSLKFTEVLLGHKYRVLSSNGSVESAGPFNYMRQGLGGTPGKLLAFFYAVALCISSFLAPNMFQTNQTAAVIKDAIPALVGQEVAIGIVLVGLIGAVLVGGLKQIATVANSAVPLMVATYIASCFIVIGCNHHNILWALGEILEKAFTLSAFGYGLASSIAFGAVRVMFTTEAGSGTSAISHAGAKTTEHVREGLVGVVELLVPLFCTMLTAFTIVVTKKYIGTTVGGALITKAAFATVSPLFAYAVSAQIPLLALTTVIAWGFYGEMAWNFALGLKSGSRGSMLFQALFLLAAFVGVFSKDQTLIINYSDYTFIPCILVNTLVLLLMSGETARDTESYIRRVDSGSLRKNW